MLIYRITGLDVCNLDVPHKQNEMNIFGNQPANDIHFFVVTLSLSLSLSLSLLLVPDGLSQESIKSFKSIQVITIQ